MKKYYGLILAVTLLTACEKKEVRPGDGLDTYVNFYNASEVLQQNFTLSESNQIIINDSLPDQRQPQFSSTDDFRQYPRHLTGSDAVIDVINPPAGITYYVVYWMPFNADRYKFSYTSVAKTFLVDTTVSLQAKTFTTQYLVESPAADDAYRILTIPVERRGTAGKVRVQVLNLSPDFGPLEVYRSDHEGNRIGSQLPSALGTDAHTPYVELDTAEASKTYNKLILKFCKSGSSEVVLTAAVDAISNSVYSIVFQGFEKATDRRIKTSSSEYEQVTVSPNLRVNVRRVF